LNTKFFQNKKLIYLFLLNKRVIFGCRLIANPGYPKYILLPSEEQPDRNSLSMCIHLEEQHIMQIRTDKLRLINLVLVFMLGSTPELLLADDVKASDLKGKTKKKPVSVLQNRFFLKSMRPEFGLMAGSFLNEAYTDTKTAGARVGMFANEWFGGEIQYQKTSVSDTEDRKALNKKKYRDLKEDKVVWADPEVNKVYSVLDVNGVVAPFYGKLNFFDQFIVYSDLYFTGGYARVETAQGDLGAFAIGAGQRFYMYESMSVRIDFRDRIYTEQRNGGDSRRNALSIDLGVSYFFL
jgi:outer membrane beta-barrel protein